RARDGGGGRFLLLASTLLLAARRSRIRVARTGPGERDRDRLRPVEEHRDTDRRQDDLGVFPVLGHGLDEPLAETGIESRSAVLDAPGAENADRRDRVEPPLLVLLRHDTREEPRHDLATEAALEPRDEREDLARHELGFFCR